MVVVVHGLIPTLLCPLVFILLPRRIWPQRERVRHVLRIWLYSLAYLAIPLAVFILFRLNPLPWIELGGSPHRESIFFIMVICLVIFWSLATRHYLKLKHAWAIGGAAVVLSYGGGLFLIFIYELTLILSYGSAW